MEQESRYDDRETALILRLAADIERDPSRAGGHAGNSLAEIERIAAEAGIEPAAVRAAARALREADRGSGAGFMGGPTEFRFERQVEGALTSDDIGELIDTIRWSLGRGGEVRAVGEAVEWKHETEEGPKTQLEVAPREGGTRIRLLARYTDPAAWMAIGGGVGAALATAATESLFDPAAGVLLGAAAAYAGAAWAGVRVWWRSVSRRTEKRLSELVDTLASQAREAAARGPAASLGKGMEVGESGLLAESEGLETPVDGRQDV